MQNARCWGPANFPAVADPAGAIAGFLFQPVTNHRPDGRFMRKHVILGILTAHLVVIDPAFLARAVWIPAFAGMTYRAGISGCRLRSASAFVALRA